MDESETSLQTTWFKIITAFPLLSSKQVGSWPRIVTGRQSNAGTVRFVNNLSQKCWITDQRVHILVD